LQEGIILDKLLNKRHVEEARLFAILLTFCGGFLDAFTYIQCGHTLAAAQTGNIVFLSAALVNHNVIGIVDRCGAIILYILGIIVAIGFQAHIKYWRIFCLFPILIIGGFVGAMPEDFPTRSLSSPLKFNRLLFQRNLFHLPAVVYQLLLVGKKRMIQRHPRSLFNFSK
jgi:hypothetical protein